ncbi:outer membrane protein assembly factor BamB family protein [Halorussus halobius]|uniref:outer membrane protein assembly factor BamB family protein n=1 Tax=Halorussus halobius TaxID=1710537 RepID=UPI001091C91E|nr:PQQ-binding-like beta-propeller repeat protein [Halorussus halobius]
MTGDRTRTDRTTTVLSRRGLLALATAGLAGLAGCGYRPGGGDVRWEIETGTGPYSPDDLLVVGDRLVTVNRSRRGFDFEAETWGESAEIAAYDAATGRERWAASAPPCGRPAVGDDSLYLGHEDGGVTALDADGSTRWQGSVEGFPRRLAAAGDRLYALTDADDLVALAATESPAASAGDRLWRASVAAETTSALAATADGVVVRDAEAAGTTVRSIRRDGEGRWSTEVPGAPGDVRPVVADGTVYVPAGDRLTALALGDGTERWSREAGRLRGSPAVGDGAVYYVADRTLSARDAEDGSVLWQFDPSDGRGFSAPPAVAGERVYAAGRDTLYALAAADGSVRWAVEADGADAAPLVVGRTVAVPVEDGVVRGHRRA